MKNVYMFFRHGRVKTGDTVTIFVHAKRINFHSLTKGWTSYIQKPLLSQNTKMIVLNPIIKTWTKSMYLGYIERAQNKRPNKNQMKGKGIQRIVVKVSSSKRRGIDFGIILGQLSGSIVLNVDVIRAGLNKGTSGNS